MVGHNQNIEILAYTLLKKMPTERGPINNGGYWAQK